MGLKSKLAKPFAQYIYKKQYKESLQAVKIQDEIRDQLINDAKNTLYGKDHHFNEIDTYQAFQQAIPVRDYEGIRSYLERIKLGEKDVLWKGQPIYFAETSGTTSGVKYIPITKDSISNHINSARNALLSYIATSGNADFVDGKLIFLSGSPVLHDTNGIPTGRLSGISNHHIPNYLTKNQVPSYKTNCIEDWETKLDAIVDETLSQDMRMISGIPPWMQMYFDKIQSRTGRHVKDIFPNLSLIVYGGVNFDPYKKKLFDSIGQTIDALELYPASEGFIAFQDQHINNGLLLNTNSGIFFEFIAMEEVFNDNPKRLTLKDVKIGVNYALVINSNAGLWGYLIGDTIKFVSLAPYRIIVSGRIKHYISAFGEHVIGEEVEWAMTKTSEQLNTKITEFTVAPMVSQQGEQSYHEWFVEFESLPTDMQLFSKTLDDNLRSKNTYYDDLISGNILSPLKITPIRKNGFIDYMKAIGKLGGQNKLPRLSNDRKIADKLEGYKL